MNYDQYPQYTAVPTQKSREEALFPNSYARSQDGSKHDARQASDKEWHGKATSRKYGATLTANHVRNRNMPAFDK